MSGHAQSNTRRVGVDLAERSYVITIGSHTLDTIDATCNTHGVRRVFVVIDDKLPEATQQRLLATLAPERRAGSMTIVADEQLKSIETVHSVLNAVAHAGLERNDAIIALGGGLVCDVAGFAAATYRRGIRVIHCPTTLLAMVDASVGGKTGVNLSVHQASGDQLLKNMVGAFHQPTAVVIDTTTLDSLPDRLFACGMAEALKHGLLAGTWNDAKLFTWITANQQAMMDRDPAIVIELIERCVQIKARVVSADERELSDAPTGRATLNLGHTFGHAYESFNAVSISPDGTPARLEHGEAVAVGMLSALFVSQTLGYVDAATTMLVRHAIEAFGLPTHLPHLPPTDRVLHAMLADKKRDQGVHRLILPHANAVCQLHADVEEQLIGNAIDAIRTPQSH